ncbi:membrane integrity-associated transporter subunit PqiC [Rheinheimera gaetbuli]
MLAAVCWLAACSSPAGLNYYQLPAVNNSRQPAAESLVLYVAPVQVASYLNGRGLVLQLSDVELNIARQHLWAEPLAAQVQRQLRDLLSNTTAYEAELSAQPDAVVLTVQLERFYGTVQGNAVLSGRYQLSNKKHSQPFNIAVALSADGYPALVTALAAGIELLSQQIATELLNPDNTKRTDG